METQNKKEISEAQKQRLAVYGERLLKDKKGDKNDAK